MKRAFLVFSSLFLLVILNKCASYTFNIATVPEKKVEIYVNEKYKSTTDENGTATIKLVGVSFEQMQFIEAKADNYYGYVNVCYGKEISPDRKNVHSVINRDQKEGRKKTNQRYDILFVVPGSEDSKPLPSGLAIAAIEHSGERQFDKCSYIATKRERNVFKNLGYDEKKIFWRNFWKKRDLDPGTEKNEFRIQYFERIRLANKKYSLQNKEGWKTDQGRVLIIYGEPDDIEKNLQKPDEKAHEIWHYYGLQGGIEFVFVNLRGGRDMRLVHSTARDEIFDSNWERWLK